MTQPASPLRTDIGDAALPEGAASRANAIDAAAALILMEVLVAALTRLPDGPSALAEACGRRATLRRQSPFDATPTELAAEAVAMALIAAARELEPQTAIAA